ncbi:LOW QUALITY PROTEIN: hypothetical protein Cgig2_017582 [Carnegiea gigantea]|uniref:Uncharacterized protein n=1 Tax=Carnegiea gigantea TaxID=171969 RepID=A0A9Q1KNA1_9CARY|nr:LOW QUALITY PROTEIN: hypothetical protein Cgig2_017582 [Carnegiea gigantea]
MAESIVSDLIVKVLEFLGQSAVEKIAPYFGGRGRLNELHLTMEMIQARLYDAERLKRVMCRLEDLLEELTTVGDEQDEQRASARLTKAVCFLPSKLSSLKMNKTLFLETQDIMRELDLITSNMDSLHFNLHAIDRGRRALNVINGREETYSFIPEEEVIGKQGSKILVTTRSKVVASSMCTIEPYLLSSLSEEKSWALFKSVAFKDRQDETNPNLISIGQDIVKKCGNVPLAIRTIAGSQSRLWFSALDVRSYFAYHQLVLNELFSSLRRLRTLDLGHQPYEKLPDSTGELKHLRYLRVRVISHDLPKGITKLRYLQTLDVRGSSQLTELPTELYKLARLKYLQIVVPNPDAILGGDICPLIDMPPRFGELISLQSVDAFIVGEKNGLDALSRMKLVGKLSILYKKHRQNAISEAINANLKGKKLTDLLLYFADGRESIMDADESLECLQPPLTLKHLIVKNWEGVSFPSWGIDELPKLVSMRILNCTKCRYLPPFSQLPHIKILKIMNCGALDLWDVKGEDGDGGNGNSVVSSAWACLKSLHSLTLSRISKLQSLPTGIGSLAALQELSIWHLDDLKTLPESIGLLTQLRVLSIDVCYKLEALPKSIQDLTALQKLHLQLCPLLKTRCELLPPSTSAKAMLCLLFVVPKGLEFSHKMSYLSLDGSGTCGMSRMKMVTLTTEGSAIVINLLHGHLSSWELSHLKTLPESIRHLTQLRVLKLQRIGGISKINSKPHHTVRLHLDGWALLKTRCKEPDGEDWPCIQHIPCYSYFEDVVPCYSYFEDVVVDHWTGMQFSEMAESIVSDLTVRVLEFLGQSAAKKIAPYFGGGGRLDELQLTLEMIQARLYDAERRQEAEDGALIKAWLRRLKRVMCRLEDLLEELTLADEQDGQRGSGRLTKVVCFLPSKLSSLRMNKTLLLEAQDIIRDLQCITSNMDRFHFNVHAIDQQRMNMINRREETISFIPEEEVLVEESWELFKRIAFHDQLEEPNKSFISVGKEIIKKCGNVPLAIRTVAGLLYSRNTVEEWLYFGDREIGMMEQTQTDIMPTLKISYYHLQPQQKQCFAYCALFPKNHIFYVTMLIRLWMAQGFVKSWDDGRICFLELLRRCFFQNLNIDVGWECKETCQMHDLMHDLAQMVGDECQLVYSPDQYVNDNVRHVGIVNTSQSVLRSSSLHKNSPHLRSYVTYELDSRYGNFLDSGLPKTDVNDNTPSLRRLRALHLNGRDYKSLPDFVGKLIHLRYLKVCVDAHYLPRGITKLRYLQTLDLHGSSNLRELPRDFYKLTGLEQLLIEGRRFYDISLIDMPPRFGELTSLQSLDTFIVGENNGLDALSRMNLADSLVIYFKKQRQNAILEAMKANLKGKKLTTLSLRFDYNSVTEDNGLLECLQPPSTLKRLIVTRWNGERFPQWGIDELPNLVSVRMSECKRCRNILPFSLLPHIKSLNVNDCGELDLWDVKDEDGDGGGEDNSVNSSTWSCMKSLEVLFLSNVSKLQSLSSGIGGLLALQELYILSLDNLRTLPESIGNLSQLRGLWILGCFQLEALPKSIQNLTALRELQINECPLLKTRCEEPHGDDWPLIQHIPRKNIS